MVTDRPTGPVTVRAPATSANLGPGFDSLALCLDLADVVTAELTSGGTSVAISGEGAADLPVDDRHLVVATMRTLFDQWGEPQAGLRLRCRNAVPQGRGLGSSAAAICAGVRLAAALTGRTPSPRDELQIAASLEGHPDNVAACLLGGLTIAWTDPLDGTQAVRLEVADGVRPVVLVAPAPLPTTVARSVLPTTVAHRAASENSARAALLIAALTTRPDLLLPATLDALHQDARRPTLETSMALVDELRAVGVAAVLSGAGPSVLALCSANQVASVLLHAPPDWRAASVAVDLRGATVTHGERDAPGTLA